jgi:hypothetical protein
MNLKIIYILFLLNLGTNTFAQLRKLNTEQRLVFLNKALNFEKNNQLEESLRWYFFIYQKDTISQDRKFVQKKIDSLIPIVRKATIHKLKGKWKLSNNLERDSTNIIFSDLIKFTNKKIIFFNKSKKIRTEKLKIEPFTYRLSYDYPSLKIGNNETWILNFREINNERRLIFEKRMDKNGQVWGMIDDRGIIKDKEKRKKALEGEIHTYYIKI